MRYSSLSWHILEPSFRIITTMKFNAVATAVSAALLAGVAHAEEEQASPAVPDIPNFTVGFFG